MRKKILFYIPVLLVLIVFLLSCASLKPWGERTSKEKALVFLEMYNAQYDDTMRIALLPNLTEEGKQIVREKKKLLTKASKLLNIYLEIVENGLGSIGLENEIMELLEKLAGMTY